MTRERLNLALAGVVVILGAAVVTRHTKEAGQVGDDGGGHSSRSHRVTPVESGDGSHSADRPRRPSAPKSEPNDITYEFFKQPASFRTLSDEGKVTKDALDVAGVDLSKRHEIQRIVDMASKRAEENMAKRITLDAKASDTSIGHYTYRIPGAREEGEEVLRQMAVDLAALVGTTEAMLLMSGLRPVDRYGGFGMYDSELVFTRRLDAQGKCVGSWVKWTVMDQQTGKVITRGEMVESLLGNRFGTLFEPMPSSDW